MNIHSGIETGQVIQRGPSGTGAFHLQGDCKPGAAGPVTIRVTGGGWEGRFSAEVVEQAWSVTVKDVPAGGPYCVEAECGDEACRVHEVFVGEVWALAGQSNMEGVGDLWIVEPPSPQVRVLTLADEWQLAEEPLHWLFESVDSAHWPCDPGSREKCASDQRASRSKGAGLGLPFGVALSTALDVPVGLLPCARGGTSMQDWSPALRDQGGASLYGSLLRRIQKTRGVRGILWYQGESDANPLDSTSFANRFRELISSLREELAAPALPFLYVQIGRFVSPGTLADMRAWNAVQEAQRQAALQIPDTAMAASVDLELDDGIHIGTVGLRRLGRRLALQARILAYGDTTLKPGPQVDRILVEGALRDLIRIEYSGVNGALKAPGRLSGFSFRDSDGHDFPIIYKQELDPVASNVVLLWLTGSLPPGLALQYGWGKDPYCNLVDDLDLAAPVFGPVYL